MSHGVGGAADRFQKWDWPTLGLMTAVGIDYRLLEPLARHYTDRIFDSGAGFLNPPRGTPAVEQNHDRHTLAAETTPGARNFIDMKRGRFYRVDSHPGDKRDIDLSTLVDGAHFLARQGARQGPFATRLCEVMALDNGLMVTTSPPCL